MSVIRYKEQGFLIFSVLFSTMLLSGITLLSFNEISNNYKFLHIFKKNLEKKKKLNAANFKNCHDKNYHSNLTLQICKNKNYIILQK